MSSGRARHLAPALTGLALGLLALGQGLAPGYLLSYDMVFVPDLAFTRQTRDVPDRSPESAER